MIGSVRRFRLIFATCVVLFAPHLRAEPTEVTVQPLITPDLPSLSTPRLRAILDHAERLIGDVVGEKVTFKLRASGDYDQVLKSLEEQAAPWELPSEYFFDIVNGDLQECQKQFQSYAAAPAHLDQIRSLLPADQKPATPKAAADALTTAYIQATTDLQALKNAKGELLFRNDGQKRFSLTRWGIYLQTLDWAPDYTLYLANGFLVDDAISDPDPLTILHKAIVNATSLQASKCTLVGYYSILNDGLSGGNLDFKKLSDDEKDNLLAYLIAQQVGIHLVAANHGETCTGGLTRPVQLLGEKADFTDPARMKIVKKHEPNRRLIASYTFRVLLRMDVLLAKEEWKKALDEAAKADSPLFDPASAQALELRKQKAQNHLIRV